MMETRKLATAALWLLAVAAVATADQFRVVIEKEACGDHVDDNYFYAMVWYGENHPSKGQLRDQLFMTAQGSLEWQGTHGPVSNWTALWEWVLPVDLKKDMAATLRRWRQDSEFMNLSLTSRVPFPGLMDILDVMRAAGFRCVYMEDYFTVDRWPTPMN